MTKGDNNPVNYRELYERGAYWLNRKHILGRIRMYVPYIGIPKVILYDYPLLNWGILIIMYILGLTSKDPNENEEERPELIY